MIYFILKETFKSFGEYLKDDEGQTSTEYILLVAVVALIVFKFKDIAYTRLMGLTQGVFSKADGFVQQMD
ncbi:MAG: phosphate-starvation-inducible PsiE family protein [Bacteriovoracaceae bacterium]|nr:phosphate-starvation-inducible PsiE family protein [Bacteriovoracaceae bacterium]